jgi:UDP-glucose 4-epimerase
MKVLVTGGAGYVGSVLTGYLIDQGNEVNILDNLSTGHKSLVDTRANFFDGDILIEKDLITAMKGCDAVVHLAGKALVAESVMYPDLYFHQNLEGTKSVLQGMTVSGIKKIIFSSTCAVYGNVHSGKISENTSTNPINPYGESKLKADEEIRLNSAKYNLDAYSFRFFNVAGSYTNNIDQNFGELHTNETHLIPNILINKKIKIFGTDWQTVDGTCIRDYVHVKDLAFAMEIALNSKLRVGHKIYNLGSGRGNSVLDVIKAANKVLSSPVKIEKLGRRPGDSESLVSDSSLILEELKWKSRYNIDTIVKDAKEFISSNPSFFNETTAK